MSRISNTLIKGKPVPDPKRNISLPFKCATKWQKKKYESGEKKGSFFGRTHIFSTHTKMHSHWSYYKVNTTNCSEEGEWTCVCLGVCADWNCLERVKWQLKGKRAIEADMVSSTSPLFVALTPCNGAELRAGLNFKCFLHIAALMLRRAEILQQRPYDCSA